MPWRFQWRPLAEAMPGFLSQHAFAALQPSWPDVATNLAIYGVLAIAWRTCQETSGRPGLSWLRNTLVVVGACLVSAAVEFAQAYVPQRTSSVYDWVANTVGAAVGTVLFSLLAPRVWPVGSRLWQAHAGNRVDGAVLRRSVKLAAWPYLLLLMAANHWGQWPWLSVADAMARVAETRWLPFANHQSAATGVALASVLWQMLLYAPMGAAIRTLRRGPVAVRPGGAGLAAMAAVATALLLEGGRLFIPGQLPDLGNVVSAACGSWFGFVLWPIAHGLVTHAQGGAAEHQGSAPAASVTPAWAHADSQPMLGGDAAAPLADLSVHGVTLRVLALALGCAVLVALSQFPVLRPTLTLGLGFYALALLWRPAVGLWVLPAALPVLDLAPVSGWFFLDELDLLVMVTLAVLLWRQAGLAPTASAPWRGRWGWLALGASVLVSGLIGVLPLQALDENAFSSYYSHYNSLRVAKGFLEGFALVYALRRGAFSADNTLERLTLGMVLGLSGATTLVIWERWVYPGVFDFSSGHRVGAFFSSMHNGGSHIEAYLAMAVPFLVVLGLTTRRMVLRWACAALFLAAAYAVLVTYARGGYAAFVLAILVVLGLLPRASTGRRWGGALRAATALTLAAAMAMAGIVLSGSFAQQRLASSQADLGIRTGHWRDALHMMDPGWLTALLGMGLGRFPESYLFNPAAPAALATFRYAADGTGRYLQLGHGQAVYVEQFVDVRPQRSYRLSLDLRSPDGPARLNVLLCARTYFASYGCESATLVTTASASNWTHHEAMIQSGPLGAGSWWQRRPIKLSLENAAPATRSDLRNIRLVGADGVDLVQNGNFGKGHDRWFFSSNFNHLTWHTKNLWVGLYFDQGAFGVAAVAAVLLAGLFGLGRAAWTGHAHAAAALASVVGFLAVGLFDSLFDAPRLTLLWLLVLGAFSQPARASQPQKLAGTGVSPPWRAAGAPTVKGWALRMGVFVAVAGLAILLFVRLPGVPYNLRALPNPFHPLLAPWALALSLWWVLGLPALAADGLERSRAVRWLFPALLMAHAALGWALMRQAVLPSMIHKVVGNPVLGWPWEWETLGRYVALQAPVFVLLTGGCLLQRRLRHRSGSGALMSWLIWSVVLLPLAHQVVVDHAATDNLTELMRNGGDGLSVTMLAAWVCLTGALGAMMAELSSQIDRTLPRRLLVLALSLPLGLGLLWAGLAAQIDKYGSSFSALQFLFSASRQDYASGVALVLRYCLFHGLWVGMIGLAQWQWLAGKSTAPVKV